MHEPPLLKGGAVGAEQFGAEVEYKLTLKFETAFVRKNDASMAVSPAGLIWKTHQSLKPPSPIWSCLNVD